MKQTKLWLMAAIICGAMAVVAACEKPKAQNENPAGITDEMQ